MIALARPSVLHRKVLESCKARAYAFDYVENCCFVHWSDYIFVCHYRRISTVEASVLLRELVELGLVVKVNQKIIKLLLV